jgi:hypothetical protein
LSASLNHVRDKVNQDDVEIKHMPEPRNGLDLSSLLGDDDDEISHGELAKRLSKLNALGIDTKAIEFLLRNAHQSKTRPLKSHLWMLQPLNFKIR